jgi:guanylate kinase
LNKGLIVVISSPSGGGKTTIVNALRARMGFAYSISTTTRPPRPGEKNGVHYYFVSKEEFLRYIRKGRFLEWAEVHGNLYGTDKEKIVKTINKGDNILLDIDVQGALEIKKQFKEAVLIFIAPPSFNVLEERLRERASDSEESLKKRLANASHEIKQAKYYDYIVVNDDLKQAVEKTMHIISSKISKKGGRKSNVNTDRRTV